MGYKPGNDMLLSKKKWKIARFTVQLDYWNSVSYVEQLLGILGWIHCWDNLRFDNVVHMTWIRFQPSNIGFMLLLFFNGFTTLVGV